MIPTAPHEHDWGEARCVCGDTAYKMIARYQEVLVEYVEYVLELQAQLDARGIDDDKVPS